VEDWNEVLEATKKVEEWSKDKPKEIQEAIQRITSTAHGEIAIEEIEKLLGSSKKENKNGS